MQFSSFERVTILNAATLMIYGDADRLIPVQNAHILDEHIPDSRLWIVSGLGDSFFSERPKEAAETTVEFLSSVPAPT
jgi:pimeloyl-ACP methyl ester carboxylesterase